jgi:hypothetical protein
MLSNRVDGSDRGRMAEHVTEWLVNDPAVARQRRLEITLRLLRRVGDRSQVLFMFAGNVDLAALRAVLQHVRRITRAVHGQWRVEMVASGLDATLLHHVREALREIRHGRSAAHPAPPSRLHPELRALIARPALLPS